MSEMAGRMSVLMSGFYPVKTHGGRGILPMGVAGVAPANIEILGGGSVRANAAWTAAGFGAYVTIPDINLQRLEYLIEIQPSNVKAIYNAEMALETYIKDADIVIGAVLVDVATDQGAALKHPVGQATRIRYSLLTTLSAAAWRICRALTRGLQPLALNNATISYRLQLVGKGAEKPRPAARLEHI
jgi:alanine dehydrogenase